MAASVLHLLETLETRLEQKNAEITALREENERLKQQLAAVAALSASSTAGVEAPQEAPENRRIVSGFETINLAIPKVDRIL